MIRYRIWQGIAAIISFGVFVLTNPATFGISPFSGDVTLNAVVRVGITLIVFFILTRFGRPKS